MKAVVKTAPGVGQVALVDVPEPTPPPGHVKLRVAAAGVCGTDMHIYKDEFKTRPPVVLGHEVAGQVVAVGEGVAETLLGTRATTETYFKTCGVCRYCRHGHTNLCPKRLSIGSGVNGGFTNYVIIPASNLHPLPQNVDLEAGALTEPLACVVHGVLTQPSISPGDVAVIAGPGTIGLLTLQVVKAAGATVVILGTNADKQRLALAQELGADHTVNVQQEDAQALIADITPEGLGADVVYECSGAGAAAASLLALVRRQGRYVQIGLFGKPISWDVDQICYKELLVTGSNASVRPAWDRALKLLADGAVLTKPLITHRYPVSAWETAFDDFESQRSIKILLIPEPV